MLFNKKGSGFNVMAASDAVGMGLNLNIRCPISIMSIHGTLFPHCRFQVVLELHDFSGS